MIKVTTTKATHLGIEIRVLADNSGHGTTYSCTNSFGRPKMIEQWFASQGEAIANERLEIDAVLQEGTSAKSWRPALKNTPAR